MKYNTYQYQRSWGAPSANLVEENRRNSRITTKYTIQGSLSAQNPSIGPQYDPLAIQDTQRIVLNCSRHQSRAISNETEPGQPQKTHSFSTINPAFIQDKSKEGMQISLRYDYPLRKPIFWRAEIGRIRPIPTVIGSVNAYRTYRERLNTQNMISFMNHHEVDLGSNLSMAEKSLQKSVPRNLLRGNAPINWVRK